ncbi:MAG: carbohydrate kinase family protein [Anaerolineales bacterium]|nr:carbohydrate kinase family protein [Anaerolineales bacterium]
MDFSFSPSPEAPVLIIGAAGVDIVGVLKGEPRMGVSNPARIRTSYGGVARNVAENLARLGQPVKLITAVGAGQVGERLIHDIDAAGVDVSAVFCTSEHPTGTYMAAVDDKGALRFAMDDMRAIADLSPAYLQARYELFKDASMLFVDANLSKETLRKAISLARRSRIPICADPTSTTLASRLRPYLSKIQLLMPNSAEAGILCGRTIDASKRRQTLEAAKYLVGQGVEIAIIALAQFGVCYATSETSGHIPAIRTEVVDPTGGGDALTAAVIFALLNGIPLDDAVRLGVSAATLTLGYPGTVIPDLTLEKLYDQLVI